MRLGQAAHGERPVRAEQHAILSVHRRGQPKRVGIVRDAIDEETLGRMPRPPGTGISAGPASDLAALRRTAQSLPSPTSSVSSPQACGSLSFL